jgi:hypothetical protein
MLGHLKLHTVGDVDLSHSLGIDFGCAGYKFEFDCNADNGTTEGYVASLEFACGGKNKDGDPYEEIATVA